MPRCLRLSDIRPTAVDAAPPGYRLAMTGTVNLNALGLASLAALVVATPLFIAATAPVGGPLNPFGGALTVSVGPLDLALGLVAGLIVLPVIHELAHGLAARLVGARPVYGVVLPVAAFCHFERFVSRGAYAFILVTPLVLISAAGVALMPVLPGWLKGPALLLLILNASGAVGDLALLRHLRAAPAGALIADTATGFEAYCRESAPSATARAGERPE